MLLVTHVFWGVMPCELVNSYWHFKEACLQNRVKQTILLQMLKLKMEAVCPSKTPVTIYQSAWCNIPVRPTYTFIVSFVREPSLKEAKWISGNNIPGFILLSTSWCSVKSQNIQHLRLDDYVHVLVSGSLFFPTLSQHFIHKLRAIINHLLPLMKINTTHSYTNWLNIKVLREPLSCRHFLNTASPAYRLLF